LILIFSTAIDLSTTGVMRWLHRFGRDDVWRINEEDVRSGAFRVGMEGGNATLERDGAVCRVTDVEAVWYRKGDLQIVPRPVEISVEGHRELGRHLQRKSARETERYSEYFHYLLSRSARVLGAARMSPNKLIMLEEARHVGLRVADFVVSDRRDVFASLLESGRPLITKAASDCLFLWDFEGARRGYHTYTERLAPEMLAAMPERIPLSLAQDEVAKRFEVRTFFLDGEMHSMAIFSQEDEETRLDYRHYNYQRPNHTVPYDLPDDVGARLVALFARLRLNTGSVDWIVEPSGEHLFLEINPSGQYAIVSISCNRDLDRRVALWLMGKHEEPEAVAV
jgi:ATP-GRASP peptide maturase of grasp-with-spasm system